MKKIVECGGFIVDGKTSIASDGGEEKVIRSRCRYSSFGGMNDSNGHVLGICMVDIWMGMAWDGMVWRGAA
jgi:hypothetical protein